MRNPFLLLLAESLTASSNLDHPNLAYDSIAQMGPSIPDMCIS